jgi:periplasmic divalent cation tolerance protein
VTECCQVTTTWPDQSGADRAAGSLVAERLAACAQVHGLLVSTFSWKGSIEQGREWYCLFKTTMDRLPALQQRIQELHPYEVPEIIALPILGGNQAYLEWIRNEVNAEPAG